MIFIGPGDYLFACVDEKVSIVLGSCVALIGWLPQHRLTLATHIMLPGYTRQAEYDLRYGGDVLRRWSIDAQRCGFNMQTFRLGLFGGSSRFFNSEQSVLSVGMKNISFMHSELNELGLTLHVEKTGGGVHRKLIFNGQTGGYQIHYLDREAENILGDESWL